MAIYKPPHSNRSLYNALEKAVEKDRTGNDLCTMAKIVDEM